MKIANGMDFVNDERVVGKWEFVGYIEDPETKTLDNLLHGNIGYKEIYFLPNGEPYWIFEGWTKGYLTIYLGGDAPIYTYKYVIRCIDCKDYLFFHKEDHTEVFIKEDNKVYSKETLGKHDNIDHPFVEDESVHGKWNSVGYVGNIEDFIPKPEDTEYYLKSMEFKDEGCLVQQYMDEVWNERWTNGLVISLHRTTAAPYIIKEINGEKYMFMEWRMGNYIYGGCKPDYYVFRKEEGALL